PSQPTGRGSAGLGARGKGEVDELDVVDGNIGAGVAAHDPLGELLPTNLLGFQQGAIPIVDVLEDAVDHVSAQLLVVGVAELVVDKLCKDPVLPGQRVQRVQLQQPEDRRLLDQDVLAGGQRFASPIEVAVIGRGNADSIDPGGEQLVEGVGPAAIDERSDPAGG